MDITNMLIKARKYKFLSECFYFPDKKQIIKIKQLKKDLPDLLISNLDISKNIKELQIDFAKLFMGPFEVLSPPYGSVYLEKDRKTFGDSSMDVIRFYQEENLCVELNEPPDHISIELEFIHFLISKEIEAHINGNINQAESYALKQKQFISIHLSKWIESFTDSISVHAQTGFYKNLATILQGEINKDLTAYNN